MEGLEQALTEIFPATVLDPGIGEIAAMMYNCFDLYPLKMMHLANQGNADVSSKPSMTLMPYE
jgi:hypothetical protein